jgi:exopolysaccharide biosynthesis polyprenyl glycosylphosphotransferase
VFLGSFYEERMVKGGTLQRAGILSFAGDPRLLAEELTVATSNRVRAAAFLSYRGTTPLGVETLPQIRSLPIDLLIIQAGFKDIQRVLQTTSNLRNLALDIHVAVPLPEDDLRFVSVEKLGSQLLLQAGQRPLSGWNVAIKRLEDVVVALTALILLSPVMAAIAIAIKLESRGPILFRQKRVGFNQELIEAWKFRSMYHDMADMDAVRQTERNDPRVTRVGRFLRCTSLDELPQLFNVLQGRMSVVGPRPHAIGTRAADMALEEVVADYAARHRVKPGITGWAQANGLRGPLHDAERARRRVEYDLEYIERWSLWLDLKIMLMTAIAVIRDPNAY